MAKGYVKRIFGKVIGKSIGEPLPEESVPDDAITIEFVTETVESSETEEPVSHEAVVGLQLANVNKLGTQIVAEILMSAGPRKDNDTGLGEDASGLILTHEHCFFWISDGTSESAILEDKSRKINFSSRVLAQDLGESFRKQIVGFSELRDRLNAKENVIGQLLTESLDGVMVKWSEALDSIQVSHTEVLKDNFDESAGNSNDFSSTFLCGVLTSAGQLQVGCFGDSPFLVQISNETRVVRPNNYRFFMRLINNEGHYYFTTSNSYEIETYAFDDVRLLVAGSDGVGLIPELVKALSGKFSFSEIRSKFSFYDPRTKDDKVLCILSLDNF